MKNVTVTLEEDVAAWARVEAARTGKSLSRFLGDLLAERKRAAGEDRLAGLRKWLDAPAWPSTPERLATRAEFYEDAYDRPGFRGHQRAAVPARRSRSAKAGKGERMVSPPAGFAEPDRKPPGSE